MLPVREDLEGAVERRRTGSEEKYEDEDEDEEEEDGHSFAKANIARYLSNVRGNTCGPYSYRTVQGTSLGGRGGWRKWGGGLGVSRWREGEGGVEAERVRWKKRNGRNKNITFRDGARKSAPETSGPFLVFHWRYSARQIECLFSEK